MVATSFSSDTPLVVTSWTRSGGVTGNWRWWGYAVGTMLAVVVFSRLWRRSGVLTDVEFMELRYSGVPASGLRAFKAVYQMLFVHCLTMGWVFLSMRKLLDVLLGLGHAPLFHVGPLAITPDWFSLIVCVVLTMVYCEVSGLWGVVVTDFIQFLVAMSGAVVLMVCVVRHFGGVGPLVDAIAASPYAETLGSGPARAGQLVERPPSEWSAPVWDFVIFVGLLWCANKNADGGGVVIQRMLATKDERHSLLGTLWYAVANFALRSWPWILVALATLLLLPRVHVTAPVDGRVTEAGPGRVVLAPHDGTPPLELPVPDSGLPDWSTSLRVEPGDDVARGAVLAATDDEQAYPVMMRRFLPAGLFGLMVASFLAAFMSSMSSHMNLATSYLVNDVYRRFLRPEASQAHYVRVARLTTPLVIVIAVVFAASSPSVIGLFDTFSKLFAGVGLVYLLRWFWWRVNVWSEIAGLLTSAVLTLSLVVWPGPASALLPAGLTAGGEPTIAGSLLLVFLGSVLVVVPVTLLTRPVDNDHLAAFFARVRPMGLWGPVPKPPGYVAPGLTWWLRLLLAWTAAIVSVLGFLFLPGTLLLAGGEHVILWTACAFGGLLVLWKALPDMGART